MGVAFFLFRVVASCTGFHFHPLTFTHYNQCFRMFDTWQPRTMHVIAYVTSKEAHLSPYILSRFMWVYDFVDLGRDLEQDPSIALLFRTGSIHSTTFETIT